MKQIRKTMITLVCVLVLCLAAACGSNNDATENGMNKNENAGTVEERKDGPTMGEDIKDDVEDLGDAVKDGVENTGDAIRDGVEDLTDTK